jgi:hypothetical protein
VSKLDGTTPKRVTSDWAGEFTGFDIWRPMRLLRRIGPVLQGITLDLSTSGDEYFPTSHVHALTREFPVVSLTLGWRLLRPSGQPERLRLSYHESEFRGAAGRLREQSVLSLDECPSLEEIIREYHSSVAKAQQPAVVELEDSVLLAAVGGRPDLVADGLRLAGEVAAGWPKSRLPLDWPGAQEWIAGLSSRAQDVDRLSAVVEGQIAKHKLAKVRVV